MQFGSPKRDHSLTNGEHILSWELSSKAQIPGSPAHTIATDPPVGVSKVLECNFQMVVSKDRIIKSITILRDTVGRREFSRCHEVFGR
jgi:hypothetical protein